MSAPPEPVRRPSEALLEQIKSNMIKLKHAEAPAPTKPNESTFLRGGLLHQIQTGFTLRKVGGGGEAASAPGATTIARGGFLHELRSKRPEVKSTASTKALPTSTKEPAPSGKLTSLETMAQNGVLKHGWLHKRAQNSIWQRRYFVLTPAALYYASNEPRKGGSLDELINKGETTRMPFSEIHDVYPTGQGGEFHMLHNERRLRLRAGGVQDASSWVAALISAELDARKSRPDAPASPSAAAVAGGLVAPSVHVAANDVETGKRLLIDTLPEALMEVALQLGEVEAVREAVRDGAADALVDIYHEDYDEDDPSAATRALELPIPTLCCEWLGRAAEAHGALARQIANAVDVSGGDVQESVSGPEFLSSSSSASMGLSSSTIGDPEGMANEAVVELEEKAIACKEGAGSGGKLMQLLRWLHPRILQPALNTLKEHLQGGTSAALTAAAAQRHTPHSHPSLPPAAHCRLPQEPV